VVPNAYYLGNVEPFVMMINFNGEQ